MIAALDAADVDSRHCADPSRHPKFKEELCIPSGKDCFAIGVTALRARPPWQDRDSPHSG
jgi:hypothetical protein